MKSLVPWIAAAILLLVLALLAPLVRLQGLSSFEAESGPVPVVDVEAAAQNLSDAVRIPTISNLDRSDFDEDAFRAFGAFLERTYPRVHRHLARERVGGWSWLYRWEGRDPDLAPIGLLAHYDVVPIAPGSENDWTQPPFDGVVADDFVWGRGAMDDKGSVIEILEAVEHLLAQRVRPARTVYLAFGHDEEVGGGQGAVAMARRLARRGVMMEWVLDEGMVVSDGMMPGLGGQVALLGVAEKGYLTLELSVPGQGGHSSMPSRETAVGILAAALHRLEANAFPERVDGVVASMLQTLAPGMPLARRIVMASPALFEPLLLPAMGATPVGRAMLHTTTAPTMLSGSNKDNVLPSNATAAVNFRIHPRDTIASVTGHVRRAIADPRVSIREMGFASEPSRVEDQRGEAYATIASVIRATFPEAVVAPGLVVGATDSRHYRDVTRSTFRFLPQVFGPQDLPRYHGTNERLSFDNLRRGIEFYIRLLRSAAVTLPN